MKTNQLKWIDNGWKALNATSINPQVCLLFGSRLTIEANPEYYQSLKTIYPNTEVIITSTAGNIIDEYLVDDTIIATAIEFEKTKIKTGVFGFNQTTDKLLGEKVANYFNAPDLCNILIFSCMGINAGNLLYGINSVLKGSVTVSGGVAGDDTRFEKTLVGLNNHLSDSQLVAVAMYGTDLKVGHGTKGGWDTFGPRRKVTKSHGNVLFEIDNKPALDLYKEYLGEKSSELPAAALLFPFAIINPETKELIVRGVQNVDAEKKSLILYADINEGETIQLMRCDFDNVIEGAVNAAKETFDSIKTPPQLAILISCVARRMALGQLTEEELSVTKKTYGEKTTLCGFYSYTELSPLMGDNACHLHNQTMTITTFIEN
jgi:hypothetical protein